MTTSPDVRSQTQLLTLLGRSVEVSHTVYAGSAMTILLLHEALGSVSYWKDFPEKLAEASGANVLSYSRAGHGDSDGPVSRRDRAAYHHEVGAVIPALLQHFAVQHPVVYGHSEGAGLAMMYAADSQQARALILESPFVGAVKQSSEHIRGLAQEYEGSRMQERLRQYHRSADDVFSSWIAGIERSSDGPAVFAQSLEKITCPVLALQGEDDEFGTTLHQEAMLAVLPEIEFAVFPQTGHLPHRQTTQAVLDRVVHFLIEIGALASPAPQAG